MAFFEWSAALDIGVDGMNKQHVKLIGIMNRLHDRKAAGAPTAELGTILGELQRYTIEHFAQEEAFMDSVKYPGLKNHKIMHANLLEKLAQHADAFRKTGQLGDDVFEFLRFWLSAHIRGIDRKYGDHCVAQTPKKAS
jgi:hemerythrin-like metal-binding protein